LPRAVEALLDLTRLQTAVQQSELNTRFSSVRAEMPWKAWAPLPLSVLPRQIDIQRARRVEVGVVVGSA